MNDFWNDLPEFPQEKEIIQEIFREKNIRIERIVSSGQSSPPGFWYDQNENEWLFLISGNAVLSLLDPDESITLKPGEFTFIQAHRKHRVENTHPHLPTRWLAVFFSDNS